MSGAVVEFIGVLIALTTLITAGYVIRDRRAKVMRELFETERTRSDELSREVGELKAENATLNARPNIDDQFHLVEKLLSQMEQHEILAQQRAQRHEERAQARSDATVAALQRIANVVLNEEGGEK